MNAQTIIDGTLWFVAFLFSTTVHEAAHAFVALRGGDRTAYHGGQVSLNPIPHIRREPVGMVLVPLLTAFTQGWAMGWASTPYDTAWAERHPRRAALMALAGPLGNLAIALVAAALLYLGLQLGWFVAPARADFAHVAVAAEGAASLVALAAQVLSILLMLNVLLAAFNLVPLPPLDGASVLGLVLPDDAARSVRRLARSPGFSLVGLLVAWRLFPAVARPLFHLVLAAMHPGMGYH